jgi:Neuroendocrine-specific golgi protein P55 (NESP55)
MAPRRTFPNRRFAVAGVLALVLVLGACGDDDDERAETTPTSPSTETTPTEETVPEVVPEETETEAEPETEMETETETETETELETPTETAPSTSPEDQPGGAGDEEPARTLAMFTGEGGRITPRLVRVPAFISIRVELRSADGREYGLAFVTGTSRVRIRVSGALGSASSTIDGLRPGQAVTGNPIGAGTPVRIEATAEPGP